MPDRPFSPELKVILVGSMPHTDPNEAYRLMCEHSPDILCWPQLPRRTFRENMYAQYSERFPGLILESDRVWVDRTQNLDPALETLYMADLEQDLSYGETSPEYAWGLHTFLDNLTELEGLYPESRFIELARIYKTTYVDFGPEEACLRAREFTETHQDELLRPLGPDVFGYENPALAG